MRGADALDSACELHFGSTRALLTGAAQLAGAYAYNVFGSVAYKTGSATNPFGYAGQYTDPETGFQYLQARYYDPATSQFLTRDPLVAVTGQPYAYAADDPINAIDPTGLQCYGFDPLCGLREALVPVARQAVIGVNTGRTHFANSDLSNEIYGDSLATGQVIVGIPGWVQRSAPTELLSDPQVYWQKLAQNAVFQPQ